jgi:hypothetical protein
MRRVYLKLEISDRLQLQAKVFETQWSIMDFEVAAAAAARPSSAPAQYEPDKSAPGEAAPKQVMPRTKCLR